MISMSNISLQKNLSIFYQNHVGKFYVSHTYTDRYRIPQIKDLVLTNFDFSE